MFRSATIPAPASHATLELLEADGAMDRLKAATGQGSAVRRRDILGQLLGRATEQEQRFLTGLILGELRQGALEGVMVEAAARAADVPVAELRRAAMMAGDLPTVAAAAMAGGRGGLAPFRLQVLNPIKPMLAQTASDLKEAMSRISPAAVEWKLDGARVQVHRRGMEVRVFTRTLADATGRVPE